MSEQGKGTADHILPLGDWLYSPLLSLSLLFVPFISLPPTFDLINSFIYSFILHELFIFALPLFINELDFAFSFVTL